MPPRKRGKRHRSQERPSAASPTTHGVELATIRDAAVAFGAGYGALLVPVERRIAQYLRQKRLFVFGVVSDAVALRSCFSLDAVAGVWVEEAPMIEGREDFGLCVLRGNLWAVGGRDNDNNKLRSCERLDVATSTWVRAMVSWGWRPGWRSVGHRGREFQVHFINILRAPRCCDRHVDLRTRRGNASVDTRGTSRCGVP